MRQNPVSTKYCSFVRDRVQELYFFLRRVEAWMCIACRIPWVGTIFRGKTIGSNTQREQKHRPNQRMRSDFRNSHSISCRWGAVLRVKMGSICLHVRVPGACHRVFNRLGNPDGSIYYYGLDLECCSCAVVYRATCHHAPFLNLKDSELHK